MNELLKTYKTFVDSVYANFGKAAAKPIIREGFKALCEAIDDNMVKLVEYLNQPAATPIHNSDGVLMTGRKAFNYFENASIKEGMWGVHFTYLEPFYYILEEGFSNGTTNLDQLAYTGNYEGGRGKDGWFFALPLDSKYLKSYDMGYGDYGFLIKTDCVLVDHLGDGDREMLFRGRDVIEKIPFYYDEDTEMWISHSDQAEYGTLEELIAKYAK